MELNATDFRKNLFQVLDRALQDQAVEINYEGSKLWLAPPEQSKLARAVRRHALPAGPMAELEKGWKRDDQTL